MIFYITGSPPSSPLPSCIFSPFEVEQYPFSKQVCDENEGGCQILPKGISLLQILLTLLTQVNYLFIKCFPLLLELLQIRYAIFSGPSHRLNPYIPHQNSKIDMTGQVKPTCVEPESWNQDMNDITKDCYFGTILFTKKFKILLKILPHPQSIASDGSTIAEQCSFTLLSHLFQRANSENPSNQPHE